MTIPYGHRFEATQALRQTLARAVSWGMINRNPAKQGIENPQRPRVEQRPFESWDELQRLADRLGRHLGPVVLFAAATGLRPSEWLALEHRDIDRAARVVYVRRAYRNGRIKHPKTAASYRAVPLQAIALDALDALPRRTGSALLFPAPRGGYLDLHNFRYRDWKPAQRDLGIRPDPARIRSQAHLCHVRAACRHPHLRPLPLHGRQPDDDRPPLRAPRQRRPPARDRPPRQLQQQLRPRGGREMDAQEEVTPNRRSEKPPLNRTSARALCRTRTDDPFLTIRVGTNGHERARMGRFCLQSQTLALPVHARSWSPLPVLSCARVTPAPR